MTPVPLSYAQQLIAGTVLTAAHVVTSAYRVGHVVEEDVLRQAVDDVVARHDALRTVVALGPDGVLDAHPFPDLPGRLQVHEIADEKAFLGAVAGGAYPPDALPLLWVHFGRYADGTGLLVLVAHQIAADPWSMPLLARDLADAYTARIRGATPLDADVMQFSEVAADDYSVSWQKTIADALPYWRSQLDGAHKLVLELPQPGTRGDRRTARFTLSPQTWRDLGKVARGRRTTPFTLLLTAFTATVWSGHSDALVPILTPGRKPSEWHTAGFMFNLLCLRFSAGDDLDALARHIDQVCRDAYAHDIPILRVLPECPDLTTVLFDSSDVADHTIPVFQLIPRSPFTATDPELHLNPLPADPQPSPAIPADLLWTVQVGDEVTGFVDYEAGLFSPEWIDDKIADFLRTIQCLTH